MDFGTLLHAAQKNEKGVNKEAVRCYSTKFEAPKKQQRSKELSKNIKKFLAKKEAEERVKQQDAARKKEELLSLRAQDKKASRRVNIMLKRTKSANQSVMQDARHITISDAEPAQPDEDDYGYVSQEASAFYNKMMEKYSKMPNEPKFSLTKKKTTGSLNSTKDRVKAALEQESGDVGQSYKRRHKVRDGTEALLANCDKQLEKQEVLPELKVDKKKKPAPPPLNFRDLLKIAEKKQFEPVIIEQKPKEEEKKLLTKKQKKEFEKEKEWKDRKKEGRLPSLEKSSLNKIPKPSSLSVQKHKIDFKKVSKLNSDSINKPSSNISSLPSTSIKFNDGMKSSQIFEKRSLDNKYYPEAVGNSNKAAIYKPTPINTLNVNKNIPVSLKSKIIKSPRDLQKKASVGGSTLKQSNSQVPLKLKQGLSNGVWKKDFPQRDIKRKPLVNNKRRILDEDYDSEMDDFIDDGPEEVEDYSKYISEIFGYDKSRYKHVDDDVDNMESTFAQQMREEVISTKIGIMEDLEDMKKEEEEKRQKALMKKKKS